MPGLFLPGHEGEMTNLKTALRVLWLPSLLAAIALAILLGLGFWQLDRLAWKEALIARVEARTKAPAVPLPPESEWRKLNFDDDEYRRVTVTGRFHHDKEAHVYTVVSEKRGRFAGPGYWVMTPLELGDGSFVIVNRGFVPLDRRDAATRREGQVAGTVSVTGLLRMSEDAGWFAPANDPAKNAWYRRAAAEIAKARGLVRTAPFTVDADATPNPGGLPQGGDTRVVFTNNHLQYAITWFGIALALVGVFIAFARQRISQKTPD
jgi:surfeit locus 1 family protein